MEIDREMQGHGRTLTVTQRVLFATRVCDGVCDMRSMLSNACDDMIARALPGPQRRERATRDEFIQREYK